MKCNDCIYEKMCESRYEREHCLSFKDKANFVEVVRCKDCVHWHYEGYDPILERVCGTCQIEYSPTFDYKEVSDNDYCSDGERSENGKS